MEGENEQISYLENFPQMEDLCFQTEGTTQCLVQQIKKKNLNRAHHHKTSGHKGHREEFINFQREQEKVIAKGQKLE